MARYIDPSYDQQLYHFLHIRNVWAAFFEQWKSFPNENWVFANFFDIFQKCSSFGVVAMGKLVVLLILGLRIHQCIDSKAATSTFFFRATSIHTFTRAQYYIHYNYLYILCKCALCRLGLDQCYVWLRVAMSINRMTTFSVLFVLVSGANFMRTNVRHNTLGSTLNCVRSKCIFWFGDMFIVCGWQITLLTPSNNSRTTDEPTTQYCPHADAFSIKLINIFTTIISNIISFTIQDAICNVSIYMCLRQTHRTIMPSMKWWVNVKLISGYWCGFPIFMDGWTIAAQRCADWLLGGILQCCMHACRQYSHSTLKLSESIDSIWNAFWNRQKLLQHFEWRSLKLTYYIQSISKRYRNLSIPSEHSFSILLPQETIMQPIYWCRRLSRIESIKCNGMNRFHGRPNAFLPSVWIETRLCNM